MDWLGILKGVTGQTAANVLDADQDKWVVDPNGKVIGVKRDPIESWWDERLGRTQEIQDEGERRYIQKLSENQPIVQELQKLRPDTKITGSSTLQRFAGDLLKARTKEQYINQYYADGGGNIPREQLLRMDNGSIKSAGEREGLQKLISQKEQLASAEFNSDQNVYDRGRQRQADLLLLDQNALERETRRGERDLDNRRQDLRELEFRMKENRLNRNDRQAAIAKIIEGIANMGYAITS